MEEAGGRKGRKQSKGGAAGKASGKLQLILQGNFGVDFMPQNCPTRDKVPVQSYPDTCQLLSKHWISQHLMTLLQQVYYSVNYNSKAKQN